MSQKQNHLNKLVDHLFRNEAGKLVATLTRIFGLTHIELAEDIVQDTLLTALNQWSVSDIPENPAAWITQVAKRKVINELKRNSSLQKHINVIEKEVGSNENYIDEIFLDKEIKDSQLRMIFTSCHPELPTESQVALTLKTLCGFGVKEIAHALFTNEATINKRLYRAKQKIRNNEFDFIIPQGNELQKRLKTVCITLYLLFNEGYNSSHTSSLIRKDLCAEAMRLMQLLMDQFKSYSELYALYALMSFHAARFDARLDKNGGIIIFEDQDRNLWGQQLIAQGILYLGKATTGEKVSEYHLEAGIAADHCLAQNFASTDWKSIYKQYELLYNIKRNPIILLNLAIIKSQINGVATSLKSLDQLEKSKELEGYYLLPATQGIFSMKIKDYKKAHSYLTKAKQLTHSKKEKEFIEGKLRECRVGN